MRFKLLLALAAITAPALAQTPHSEIETNILALETAWTQAQTSRNTQTLSTLLADNFVYTGYTGAVMTKKEFLADLKDGSYAPTLVVNQNQKVVSYNHAAVVTGVYHTKGMYRSRPFERWGHFTDIWLFQDNLWQCVASHTSPIK
jgi:hypothetical protein